ESAKRAHGRTRTRQLTANAGATDWFPALPVFLAGRSGRDAALVMTTFADLLLDLGHERLEIGGAPARDHAIIDDDRLVPPVGAGVDHVRSDRFVGGGIGALDDACLDQQPRPVADGGEDLARPIEVPDELHGFFVDP